MLESERFFYSDGKRLLNEYVDGQVQIYQREDGSRSTFINCSNGLITIERVAIPLPIPRDYGSITVESGNRGIVLAVKKPVLKAPIILVESRERIIGKATGEHFDLALAYTLGISDPELVIDAQDTKVDPEISDIIADIIFQS